MSEQNVIEVIVVPEVPKVVPGEEIYVYVPIATNDTKGIASFDKNSINVVAGVASVNDNYVNELIDTKVQPADDKKLDKLTTHGIYVYAHNAEEQTEIAVSKGLSPNTVVVRNENAGITVSDNPLSCSDAINTNKLVSVVNPINKILRERTEVYLTKDEQGNVYIHEAGKDDVFHLSHNLVKELNIITNEEAYKYTFSLEALDGSILSSCTIDLPLESVIVNGTYDEVNKSIVLTLKNGNKIIIPVENVIDGLATKNQIDAEAATRQQKDEELQKNIDDVPFFVGTDGYIYGKD